MGVVSAGVVEGAAVAQQDVGFADVAAGGDGVIRAVGELGGHGAQAGVAAGPMAATPGRALNSYSAAYQRHGMASDVHRVGSRLDSLPPVDVARRCNRNRTRAGS